MPHVILRFRLPDEQVELNVVPLYRHPPCQDLSQKNFTLTDAEREASEIAIRWLEPYPQVAATLRNLLERMK